VHDSLRPQHTGTSAARWRPKAAARYAWELLGVPACIGIDLARCPFDNSGVGSQQCRSPSMYDNQPITP
jgi:hypothetical protein